MIPTLIREPIDDVKLRQHGLEVLVYWCRRNGLGSNGHKRAVGKRLSHDVILRTLGKHLIAPSICCEIETTQLEVLVIRAVAPVLGRTRKCTALPTPKACSRNSEPWIRSRPRVAEVTSTFQLANFLGTCVNTYFAKQTDILRTRQVSLTQSHRIQICRSRPRLGKIKITRVI